MKYPMLAAVAALSACAASPHVTPVSAQAPISVPIVPMTVRPARPIPEHQVELRRELEDALARAREKLREYDEDEAAQGADVP